MTGAQPPGILMKRKRIFGLIAKGTPAIISCLSNGAMQEGHIGGSAWSTSTISANG
jgi:hypothetical protein